MKNTISIIMTSYNYASYIREAIESVLSQSFKDWEFIIVDDASNDNSTEIITEYQEKDFRIKLIQNDRNIGLAKSIQKGLEIAQGEWIAFLESDDFFSQNSLEEKFKAAELGGEIIFSDVELIGDKDKIENIQKTFENRDSYIIDLNKSMFIENFRNIIYKSNIIPTFSSAMVKKELLKECDFNPICPSALDYYIWAQLCHQKIYYINKKLTYWRLHKDSYINKKHESWLSGFLFNISIYSQTLKNQFFLKRIVLMLNYIRCKILYISFKKKYLKISFLNNKFIFEKNIF